MVGAHMVWYGYSQDRLGISFHSADSFFGPLHMAGNECGGRSSPYGTREETGNRGSTFAISLCVELDWLFHRRARRLFAFFGRTNCVYSESRFSSEAHDAGSGCPRVAHLGAAENADVGPRCRYSRRDETR